MEQCMDLVGSYGDIAQDVLIGQAKNVLEFLLSRYQFSRALLRRMIAYCLSSYSSQGVLLGVLKVSAAPRQISFQNT